MLDKLGKIMGVLAGVTAVVALILTVLTQMDIVSLFGPKTYEVEYEPGIYIPDGYVSTFLGYQFNAPEGYRVCTIEERAKYSGAKYKNASVSEMETNLKNMNALIDLFAVSSKEVYIGENVNAMVVVMTDERITKKDLEECMDMLVESYTKLGITGTGDYEIIEYLGKKCGTYLGTITTMGVTANQKGYIFVENGFAWFLGVSYLDGMEEEAEKLLNAFEIYE